MSINRYILESSPVKELQSKARFRVKECPCGKSNSDGKFVPFKDSEDRGYCHSCEQLIGVGNHTCPQCKKEKAFNRYIDTKNNDVYIDDRVGKCLFCSFSYSPKIFFQDNMNKSFQRSAEPIAPKKTCFKPSLASHPSLSEPKKVSFIDPKIFQNSLSAYGKNEFVSFLRTKFGNEITSKLVSKYYIGTSKYWPGATIFWQIDRQWKIRSGKVMLYDAKEGKRSKDPYKHPSWVHTVLDLPDFNLEQCFFGEHLLKLNPTTPVAIVESEKTAIIASVYLPEFIWLACGGKTHLKAEKFKILAGRNVVFYPDLNAFDEWSKKAKELSSTARIIVSDLLEKRSTQKEKELGLDLADYLIRFPVNTKPRTLDPINIIIDNIIKAPDEFKLGSEFNHAIMAWVKTTGGIDYDILFDGDENLLTDEKLIDRIAKFYDKNFVEVIFDGNRAFAQINPNRKSFGGI